MPLVVRTVGIALLVVLGGVYGGCAPTSDSKKNAGMLSPAQMRKTGMEDPEIRLVEQVLQLADSNRYDRALELSDSLARLTPTLPHGQYLKGRLLMEREKRLRAKAALKQAVRADSTFVPAQRWLGEAYRQEGELEKALNHWTITARLRPESSYFQYVLGSLYMKTGRLDKALDQLKPIANKRPVQVHAVLGRTYSKRGEWSRARGHLQRALRHDSTYDRAHFFLSKSYESEGRLRRALASARRAFQLRPDTLLYRYYLGRLFVEVGSTKVGADLLAEVLARDSTHHGALYNRAQALRDLGREEAASSLMAQLDSLRALTDEIKRLNAKVETHPKDPQLWHQLGQKLERVDQRKRAAQAYRHALSLVPTNMALANNIANLLIREGDTTKAVEMYRRILRRDSTVITAWLNLGAVYAKQDRLEKARKAWRQVLELEPGHERARRYLTRIEK